MRNFKTFSLFSMWSGKWLLQIQTVLTRLGGFKNRSKIVLRDRKKDVSYRDNKARYLAKKRGMGYHRLSFYHNKCQMHHINRNDVVAVPELMHILFPHNFWSKSARRLEGVLG